MKHPHVVTDDCTRHGRPRPVGRIRAALRALAAVVAGAVCVIAQDRSGAASSIERLVAADAAVLLDSKDAITCGEAALVVASIGDPQYEPRILAMAADPQPAARRRATIALGLLATPSAVQYLEACLRPVDGRSGDDAVAAAFALGLVPPDRVGTSIARTLPLFTRGSYKRQHDVLLALLMAMTGAPDREERPALRQLLDDESNRAPDVRALLLRLLLPIDPTLDDRLLRRTLSRGSDPERLALLQWLANRPAADNRDWLAELVQAAQHDSQPANRTAALLALTRSHHLPALEIAARALRSSAADECAQAQQAMLTIGGASTRGALEQHLFDERDADRKTALLHSYLAPPSTRLADHAVALATDGEQALSLRVAAAELIARSQPQRAAPLLRDLFRLVTTPAELCLLADALQRVESTPTALGRLVDSPVALDQHPDSWQALLAAGHGEAQRRVLAMLQSSTAAPASQRTALVAWRKARVLAVPDLAEAATPAGLQSLLR